MFNKKAVGALDALQAQQEKELQQILQQHRRQLLEAQAQQQQHKSKAPLTREEEDEEDVVVPQPKKPGRKPKAKSPPKHKPVSSEDEIFEMELKKPQAKRGRKPAVKSPPQKPMSSDDEAMNASATMKTSKKAPRPQPMSSEEEEEEQESAQPFSQPRVEKMNKKPKQPLNAFMIFRMKAAPELKQKNPKMSLSELNQEISQKWQNMQPHVKDSYIREAKEAQLAYVEAKRNYGRQLYCCAGLTMVFPPGGKKHKAELVAQESERLGNEWSALTTDEQDRWLKNEKRRMKKFEKLAL